MSLIPLRKQGTSVATTCPKAVGSLRRMFPTKTRHAVGSGKQNSVVTNLPIEPFYSLHLCKSSEETETIQTKRKRKERKKKRLGKEKGKKGGRRREGVWHRPIS